MKFWKDNKISGEFEWPVNAVADAFMSWYWTQPDEIRDGVPLERMLRGWLTAPEPDGFSSVWEAETGPDSFGELFDQVRERARA